MSAESLVVTRMWGDYRHVQKPASKIVDIRHPQEPRSSFQVTLVVNESGVFLNAPKVSGMPIERARRVQAMIEKALSLAEETQAADLEAWVASHPPAWAPAPSLPAGAR